MGALRKRFPWNGLIAFLFIVANIFAVAQVISSLKPPHIVDPIKDEEVEQLLNYIASGNHSGETWQVTLTNLEAEQTITWYLKRYPQIPFAYPQVHITPDYLEGQGDVTIAGVRSHVGARVKITLKDGLPVVEILSMDLPLALQWAKEPVERVVQQQLRRAELLPVRFISAEWKDGEVVVKGIIK